jgi:hypothetical protein
LLEDSARIAVEIKRVKIRLNPNALTHLAFREKRLPRTMERNSVGNITAIGLTGSRHRALLFRQMTSVDEPGNNLKQQLLPAVERPFNAITERVSTSLEKHTGFFRQSRGQAISGER